MKYIALILAVIGLSSCKFNAGMSAAKEAISTSVAVKVEQDQACVCFSWGNLLAPFIKEEE
tara:strand:- start:585 stop:767 length:183 start_codon:yes stop_codon:yes gene_type:complete